MHEDILVFLIQDENGQIFITYNEEQEERACSKAFEQTQASSPIEHTLVFLRWEKFLLGSDGELKEQPLPCSISTKSTHTHTHTHTHI